MVFGMGLLSGLLGVGLVFAGRRAIRTKTANARRIVEKMMANDDGQITGTPAVLKGYVLLIGGVVLIGMALLAFGAGVYLLFAG